MDKHAVNDHSPDPWRAIQDEKVGEIHDAVNYMEEHEPPGHHQDLQVAFVLEFVNLDVDGVVAAVHLVEQVDAALLISLEGYLVDQAEHDERSQRVVEAFHEQLRFDVIL